MVQIHFRKSTLKFILKVCLQHWMILKILIFSKIKFRDIIAGGFLLSARFSLIIAMAEIGVHLDLISVELEQQIILLAVITATFSPILFRIFRSKAN